MTAYDLCTCQWKGNSKVTVCQKCHMHAISALFNLDRLRKIQALPVEYKVTRKFALWPVRDPKSKKLRIGRISIYEQTYVKLFTSYYIPESLWGLAWLVTEIRSR